jgi:hypothetical protein
MSTGRQAWAEDLGRIAHEQTRLQRDLARVLLNGDIDEGERIRTVLDALAKQRVAATVQMAGATLDSRVCLI